MTPNTLPAILPGTTPSNVGSAASKTNKNSSAQNRFLTLLVAQMQAQDPLNPMDNAQMTTQLAQISTVDGVEKLNVTMEKLLSQFGALEQLNATSLIGRSVLIPADSIDLSKDGAGKAMATAGFELPQQASRVKIEIKDANGLPLRTIDMGTLKEGIHTFNWDGKTDAGVSAPDGRYSFTMIADANGSALSVRKLSVAHVEGMRKTDNRTILDLGVYGLRPQSDVLAVY
jgi:flagellar basal-body rod modification protein FlgD